MSVAQYVFYPTLTPARLAATANIVGVYNNGINDNGIGATLTNIAFGTLTIDGVIANLGDRVLLGSQTIRSQNGVYIVVNAGDMRNEFILQRTSDFQSPEQLRAGMSIAIGAGAQNAGGLLELIEPLPNNIGFDPITFANPASQLNLGTAAHKNATDNTKPYVSSVAGAVVSGRLASFSDSLGTVQDSGIVLGNAAFKNATDNTKPTVASLSGPTIIDHAVIFADNNGTLADSGVILGTAATKNVSDPTLPTVPSLSGGFRIGNSPVFSSTTGTIADLGSGILAGSQNFAGGSTSFTLSVPGVTAAFSYPVVCKLASQNVSFINTVVPSANALTITLNTDPGISTFSYIINVPF